MSRTSSTFGKQTVLKSSLKHLGGTVVGPTNSDMPTFSKSLMKRSGSWNSLHKSSGNLAASFSNMSNASTGKLNKTSATDLDRIETEYIKNLQQQVYFLELESNFLREQARKATDMHPQMTSEAERMLLKLRQMQAEVDNLNIELRKKDSHLQLSVSEKDRIISRLKAEDETHSREKRLLVDEVVQVKKEKEALERDGLRKDAQIHQAREETTRCSSALREEETKMQLLKNQMEQSADQHKITKDALELKRKELLECETRLRDMEEKYYASSATQTDQVVEELRDEVRELRLKVKEAEMAADQERYLRNKMSEDSAHLVKENALLNQQVLDLQKQMDREKSIRESQESRRTQSIADLVASQEKEKFLQYELEQTKELLKDEREKNKEYLEELGKKEQLSTSQEFNNSTVRSELAEVEHARDTLERENQEFRRDKMLLVDHVADLQKQVESKDSEMESLRTENQELTARLSDLSHLKELEGTLQSQKWEEFSQLADSMKRLTQTMSHNGTSAEYA